MQNTLHRVKGVFLKQMHTQQFPGHVTANSPQRLTANDRTDIDLTQKHALYKHSHNTAMSNEWTKDQNL